MTRNATLIDIAAMQALYETEDLLDLRCGDDSDAQKIIHAIVDAVKPLIRAAALEEAAKVIEEDRYYSFLLREEIAAAIRSLKDQP